MDKRRPIWPVIAAALIGVPVLYVLSFGPACWICDWLELPYRSEHWLRGTYRPLLTLSFYCPEPVGESLLWYGSIDDVEYGAAWFSIMHTYAYLY